MADDRVFIKCKTCGDSRMLMKFFSITGMRAAAGIAEWIDGHSQCHPRLYDTTLKGDPGFALLTESDVEVSDD